MLSDKLKVLANERNWIFHHRLTLIPNHYLALGKTFSYNNQETYVEIDIDTISVVATYQSDKRQSFMSYEEFQECRNIEAEEVFIDTDKDLHMVFNHSLLHTHFSEAQIEDIRTTFQQAIDLLKESTQTTYDDLFKRT